MLQAPELSELILVRCDAVRAASAEILCSIGLGSARFGAVRAASVGILCSIEFCVGQRVRSASANVGPRSNATFRLCLSCHFAPSGFKFKVAPAND